MILFDIFAITLAILLISAAGIIAAVCVGGIILGGFLLLVTIIDAIIDAFCHFVKWINGKEND